MGLSAIFLVSGLTTASAQSWTSAYTSPTATGNCAGLQDTLTAGFTTTKIVSQALFGSVAPLRVLKMAFWKQPSAQYTDIYIVEKGSGSSARILYYNGATSALSVMGTLTGVNFGGNGVDEDGLLGIAVNPVTHGTDNYIYLYFSVGTATGAPSWSNGWRISRFSIDPATKAINFSSEKVLLTVPASHNARWHTAGALQFDNFGNLYIATGDNEALAMGSGNTANLRGAVLRIHPDESPRGYSIPAGNFGEYWAQKWQDSGLTARAAEYRDTSKVKAELYIKGSRNPYTISLDKNRLGWLQWSECGPDNQRNEEHNFTTKPAFSGWPFWAGNAVRQTSKAGSYGESPDVDTGIYWTAFNPNTMTTQIPVNNYSLNPGVDTLPPMHVPAHSYSSPTCAAGGGPIIRYDGRISNPTKMPPHLDNVAMYSDFTSTGVNTVWAKKIDTLTGTVTGTVKQALKMPRSGRPNLSNPVDFQQGPDGNLYMVDWGTGCCSTSSSATQNGIVRVSYTGTCEDPGLYPTSVSRRTFNGTVDWLRVSSRAIHVSADGAHEVRILDLGGRLIRSYKGSGQADYAMPALGHGKLYVLRVSTPLGTAVRTFSRL